MLKVGLNSISLRLFVLNRPIAISLYHAYLHRWLEVFPREQILVVNGDLLIEDPVPQLRRIEKFLGLEHKIGKLLIV